MRLTLFLIPYILSLLVTAAIGLYAVVKRRVVGASEFAVVALAEATMVIGYLFELYSPTLSGKVFWDDFQWIGTFVAPVGILMFACVYTGRKMKNPARRWLLLLALPAIFILLIMTDRFHGLVRPNVQLVPGEPFDELTYDWSVLIYMMFVYIYILTIASYYLLVRHLFQASARFRRQLLMVLTGLAMPLIGGILTIAGVQFGLHRDTTPFTFAIGGVFIAWGLFRYDLFGVVPVARDRVVENIPDAVLVMDAQNRLIDFNPAARQLSEIGDEAIGTPVLEVFHGAEDKVLQVLNAEKQPVDIEYIDDEAGPVQFEVTLSPITDRRGRLQGRVVVLRNVTERRQIEERLREAWHVAEEADRVKTQFLASMSHELRTPLSGVLSLTEMVMLEMFGPLNEKQTSYLQKAIASGEHLLDLINDILDINKIQAGKLDLFIEEDVSLNDELAQVTTSAQALLMNKPVRLVTDIDTSLPRLDCDRRRMRQVMLNLVSNACKFTEQGTVTVSAKYLDSRNCLQLMVSDTGPGIDAADMDVIFEPFTQTETGKAHASGTGLGLPISRHLVEMHKGRIWVESEPGDGAAFFVEIPVHRELQAAT